MGERRGGCSRCCWGEGVSRLIEKTEEPRTGLWECELLVHHWLGGSSGAVRGVLLVGRGCAWKAVSSDKAWIDGELVTGGFAEVSHDGT